MPSDHAKESRQRPFVTTTDPQSLTTDLLGPWVRDRGRHALERAGRRSLTIVDRSIAKLRPRAAARSAAPQYCRVAIEHSCHFSGRKSDDTTQGGPCFDPGGSALP
jgi:hypothetical protein